MLLGSSSAGSVFRKIWLFLMLFYRSNTARSVLLYHFYPLFSISLVCSVISCYPYPQFNILLLSSVITVTEQAFFSFCFFHVKDKDREQRVQIYSGRVQIRVENTRDEIRREEYRVQQKRIEEKRRDKMRREEKRREEKRREQKIREDETSDLYIVMTSSYSPYDKQNSTYLIASELSKYF